MCLCVVHLCVCVCEYEYFLFFSLYDLPSSVCFTRRRDPQEGALVRVSGSKTVFTVG